MDKAFWNTQGTPTGASLEVARLRSCGCTSAFQFRAGSDQVSISGSSLQGMRLEVVGGNKKLRNAYNVVTTSSAPNALFYRPTAWVLTTRWCMLSWWDPAGAGKCCTDATTGPRPALSSPLPCTPHCLHDFSSSSPTPRPPRQRGLLHSLLIQHKQSSVNSICSPSPWDREALGEETSGTWRQACLSTQGCKGWGNWFDSKWSHCGIDPQPLDSELLRRETTVCSSSRITRLAGI